MEESFDIVDESVSCEINLSLVDTDSHIRLENFRIERSESLSLEVKGWKRETEVIRGPSFASGYDVDEIKQVGWFRFMEEIVMDIIMYCMHCSTLSL